MTNIYILGFPKFGPVDITQQRRVQEGGVPV